MLVPLSVKAKYYLGNVNKTFPLPPPHTQVYLLLGQKSLGFGSNPLPPSQES